MIVFTATDQVSGKVFAGSTRLSLEDHWDNLLTQEAEGAMGEFFETLRKSGIEAFKVEEWGYSDNPKELREILAEAIDDLGALPIKPVLGSGRKTENKAASQVMKELEELKQAMAADDDSEDDQPAAVKKDKDRPRDAVEISKSSTKVAADPKPLRHTRSTEEAAEMRALIAGIEARRRANLKSNRKVSSKKSTTKSSTTESTRAATAKATKTPGSSRELNKPKLAEGRASSSAKEKRIREAIASQKAEQEAKKRDQAAAEAQEMREIMSRLDERAKSAAKVHRRM